MRDYEERYRRRREARREILPGFPITEQITTVEELREYRERDRIVCLLCGKLYKDVGKHIGPIHGVTVEEYHRMYGLPWHRGLTCDETHEKYSRTVKRRIEAGWRPELGAPSVEELHKAQKRERFPVRADILRKECITHTPTHKGEDTTIWKPHHYEEFLRRIASGRITIEVCADPDMPGEYAVYEYMRKNPDFRTRFNNIFQSLPFHVQARAENLGETFRDALKRLLDSGFNQKQCAKILGVQEMTISRHARRLK